MELLLKKFEKKVKEDEAFRQFFNGIHRFILEDRIVLDSGSKNKIRKKSKEVAYRVIQRSDAWSCLVENKFPQSVRLSIHPQPKGSKKIGIRMIDSENIWATPWHNVLFYDGKNWQLMKRKVAEEIQAQQVFFQGKYGYYVVGEQDDEKILAELKDFRFPEML